MLKKLLLTGILTCGICFFANFGFAADTIESKLPCATHCNEPGKYEQLADKPCLKYDKECNCKCEHKSCPKCAECPKCEKCPKCSDRQKCQKCKMMMQEFFNKADCYVNLTPEQKLEAEKIKKATIDKVTPIKKQIIYKKKEIRALRLTRLAQQEMDRRIAILEKEIKALKKEVKKEIKKSDKCYKKLLTTEQKKLYKEFKKEWKNSKKCHAKKPCIKGGFVV